MADTGNTDRVQSDINEALRNADQINEGLDAVRRLATLSGEYRNALTRSGFSRTEAFALVSQLLHTLDEKQAGRKP